MTESKIDVYLKLIKKSHEIFLDYLIHIPEEVLDWTISTNANSVRWILVHTLKEQQWIAKLITGEETTIDFSDELSLDDLISAFEVFFSNVEQNFVKLNQDFFEQKIIHKNFVLTGEDWIYEYIHHFSFHSGEIGFYLTQWKRKNRSLQQNNS